MPRLRMTNADYVAIAVSPALVMALVGSLVFFLLEVLYVGDYSGRLNYVFALFVFATVLIARIAIEMGSERAAMFSIPLGLLMFIALGRFADHGSPFGWLINLGLLAAVWWSSHKLTWDCTVIDDNQDSSGEGLLGRVGVDEQTHPEPKEAAEPAKAKKHASSADNELFNDPAEGEVVKPTLWQRIASANTGPHTPGLWVLYFSLAALPLFGVGQHWIPAGDTGRRQYAFGLLAVYVAAGLSLLVTTSFLGLRRYLRQRNVEMPAPMAATWVSLGAVLIAAVMFVAALLPRPAAEYAAARPPWQIGSASDNSSNRLSVGNEGTVDPDAEQRVTSDNQADAPTTGEPSADGTGPPVESSEAEAGSPPAEGSRPEQNAGEPSEGSEGRESGESESSPTDAGSADAGSAGEGQGEGENSESAPSGGEQGSTEPQESTQGPDEGSGESQSSEPQSQSSQQEQAANEQSSAGDASMSRAFEHPETPPAEMPKIPDLSTIVNTLTSSLATLLKLVFYALLAAAIIYFAWRNWPAIVRAFFEIVQMLRDLLSRLFGGKRDAAAAATAAEQAPTARRRTFSDFTDPFLSGRAQQTPPTELVRYTFEAFEAWSSDRGQPRSLDQTPQEFVRLAAPPATPTHEAARRMVQLYSQAAYASANISRDAANNLRELWHLMQSAR